MTGLGDLNATPPTRYHTDSNNQLISRAMSAPLVTTIPNPTITKSRVMKGPNPLCCGFVWVVMPVSSELRRGGCLHGMNIGYAAALNGH